MSTTDPNREIDVDGPIAIYSGKIVKEYTLFYSYGGPRPGQKIVPAVNILNRGVKDVTNRRIVEYSTIQGDSGDGSGPGFFGLLLEKDDARNLKREWLVVTLTGCCLHCIFDDRLVGASSAYYHIQKPLIRYEGPKLVDEFGPDVNGATIKEVDLQQESFTLRLEKDGKLHTLEIPNKDSRLDPYVSLFIVENGQRKPRPAVAFPPGHHMGEYIVFIEEDGIIYA